MLPPLVLIKQVFQVFVNAEFTLRVLAGPKTVDRRALGPVGDLDNPARGGEEFRILLGGMSGMTLGKAQDLGTGVDGRGSATATRAEGLPQLEEVFAALVVDISGSVIGEPGVAEEGFGFVALETGCFSR